MYYGPALSAGGGNNLTAPLHLPDGPTITAFRCYTYDNAAADISAVSFAQIVRKQLAAGAATFVSAVTQAIDLATSGTQATLREHTAPLVVLPLVDNAQFAYWIDSSFVTTAGSLDVRLYGCRISYEISQLNP